MSKINQTTKTQIAMDFALTQNKTETARKFGISPRTVGRILDQIGLVKVEDATVKSNVKPVAPTPESHVEEADINVVMTGRTLSISYKGQTKTIEKTHMNFEQVKSKIMSGNYDEAMDLIDVRKSVDKYSKGLMNIEGNSITYRGQIIQNGLSIKIITMMQEGDSGFEKVANFFAMVMENPSASSRNQLMNFVEHGDVQIDEEGYVIGFKNVNNDYKPSRAGRYDEDGVYHPSEYYVNTVGSICEMPRELIDDNPKVHCSQGLHVCSVHYLKSFWGTRGKTMKVRVHPRDCVAVPDDYKNTKMRTCRYEVVEDVTKDLKKYLDLVSA